MSAAIEEQLHFRKRQSDYSESEVLEAMVLLMAAMQRAHRAPIARLEADGTIIESQACRRRARHGQQ